MAGRGFKILGILSDVVLGILLFAILSLVLLRIVGIDTYVVMSGSMEPEIHTGSLCFINTNEDYSEIQQGDIIAFCRGEVIVTHRAIAVTEQGIETKGDNNDVSDGITTVQENYVGKTVVSIPYAGYIMWNLTNVHGKLPLILIIIMLLLLGRLAEILSSRSQNTEQSHLI